MSGRPSKLTPEVSKTICANLAEGMARKGACALARVSYEAMLVWLREGRKQREAGANAEDGGCSSATPISPYLQFLLDVEDAEAGVEKKCVATLMRACATGDVGAARYWLNVRRKASWKEPNSRIEHRGSIKLEYEKLSDEELEERIKAIEARRGTRAT